MSYSTQPSTSHNWDRFIPEYNMMNSQPVMVYSQRPVMMPISTYNTVPVQDIPPPPYQATSSSYMPYPSPPHMPTSAMGLQHRYETQHMTHAHAHESNGASNHHSAHINNTHSSSNAASQRIPSFSREEPKACYQTPTAPLSPASSVIPMPKQSLTSKTIIANEPKDSKDLINFDTNVDQLMKAIQHDDGQVPDQQLKAQRPQPQQQLYTPAPSPRSEGESGRSSPAASMTSGQSSVRIKKYICQGPNCNKSFSQKTHLEIHSRTHTGLRPYSCEYEGCNLTFSQLGNLKTHMRRHTGDKPFECETCGKRFAQRGNVRSHEETHRGLKPFVCILENCDKQFSQLGNMKTHQNNFHKEALADLTNKFVKFTTEGHIPEEYRALFDYFKLHYKNSNKGIKGRGKDRKVVGKDAKAPKSASTGRSTSSRRKVTGPVANPPQQHSPASSPPMYSVTAGYMNMNHNIPRNTGVSSYAPAYTLNHGPGQMVYNNDQTRHMSMGEHIY